MDVIIYLDAWVQFKVVMDCAINDREEVIVTCKCGESVVVVLLDMWNAIIEILYLQFFLCNAVRLYAVINELDAGVGQECQLFE